MLVVFGRLLKKYDMTQITRELTFSQSLILICKILMLLQCLTLNTVAQATDQACLVVEISSGPVERAAMPLCVEVPAALQKAKELSLREVTGSGDAAIGKSIPCQIEAGSPLKVWWMLEHLPAGESRRYRLSAVNSDNSKAGNGTTAPAPDMTAAVDGQALAISVEGLPVLKYQQAVMPSADPAKPFYARSGFIHPIFDPAGRAVTEAMPADHMHQHALMFAWVNAEFEGRKVDFWNSHKEQGLVRNVRLEDIQVGPVFISFKARLEHVDETPEDGPRVALQELWEVKVFHRTDGFLFDWQSTLTCATESPLKLLKHDYGGLCLRGRDEWNKADGGEFLTSEGKTRANGNHTRPHWCDLSGPILQAKPVPEVKPMPEATPATGTTQDPAISLAPWGGIAVLDHPSNFRFPQPVRLHPSMPYLSVTPAPLGPFEIEPGKPYITRFRFFTHTGKPEASLIDQLWEDYAQPVASRVIE